MIIFRAFLILSIFSFNLAQAEEQKLKTLHVGVLQSLAGVAADDGTSVVRALTIAADEINSKSPEAIKLIIEDDRSTPRDTVSSFQRLTQKKVDIVIGATWDFLVNPLFPFVAKSHIPLFVTSCPIESISLEQSEGYGFTNNISMKGEAQPFKDFLSKRNIQTIALVYTPNPWGETQRDTYKKIAEELSKEIVEEIHPTTIDSNDWDSIVLNIKKRQPDAVLLLLNQSDIELMLQRMKALAISSAVFTSPNGYKAFKKSKEKGLYENVCWTYPLKRLQSHKGFGEVYRTKYNEEPSMYSDFSYDALYLIYEAWKKAQKEGSVLTDALKKTTYKGIVGTYQYSPEASFSTGESSLSCVKNGEAIVP